MGQIEDRMDALGLSLPAVFAAPGGIAMSFDLVRVHGDVAYISGHGPIDGASALMQGKVGGELSIEQGYEAARLTGLFTIVRVPPRGSLRCTNQGAWSTASSGVRWASSAKNTRPPGFSARPTRSQKASKRDGGTCESQNPNTTVS